MEIVVKAYATIRRHIHNYPGESGIILTLSEPVRVNDLLTMLKIPPPEVGLVLINGIFSQKEYILKPGDAVQLFPFIEGG